MFSFRRSQTGGGFQVTCPVRCHVNLSTLFLPLCSITVACSGWKAATLTHPTPFRTRRRTDASICSLTTLMESVRNTNEWMGATASVRWPAYPAFALSMNPALPLMAAWGEVTERSFGADGGQARLGHPVDRGGPMAPTISSMLKPVSRTALWQSDAFLRSGVVEPMARQGSAGGPDVRPLRNLAAVHRRQPTARLRCLYHRLAQCP